MSKPLELTTYPPVPYRSSFAWARLPWNHPDVLALMRADEKRLTEAELCAEYESARCDAMIQSATGQCWSPLFDTWPMDPEAIHNRERALLRFASRPHYYEAAEPESDTE